MPHSPSSPPLRALHIINGEHYSGAERVQDLLAMALPAYGVEVGFACVKPVDFAARRSSGVPLFQIPMRSRSDWLRVAKQVANLIRQGNYTLIHTHTPRAALIGRLAAHYANVPMVHHVHSPARFDSTRPVQNWLNAMSERICARKAAAIIAVSESIKTYLQHEGFAAARIHVITNGVPSAAALAPWQPPKARPWKIGMVALFRPRKGIEVLLDAMAQLRAIELRAIGPFESPDYEAAIHREVAAKGLQDAVQWVGYTPDVQKELAQLDALVLPSLGGEGLPMVILEAMAAGVPVIASAIDGVSQAIRDGVDGLLVTPGDASSLAVAFKRVMSGQCASEVLRENAYARQKAEFSDVRMAQSVAELYRRVLA